MFFLLRVAFWLTVVFLLLPTVIGGPASNSPSEVPAAVGATGGSEPKVSAFDALSAASAAAADAGGFCARQPQACAIGASLIELIGQRAEAGARFALGYLSDQIVEEKRKAAARATGTRSGDTLTTHDLSPAWQGPRLAPGETAERTGAAGAAPTASPPTAVPASPATPGGVPLPPKRPA
ncbi:DUF5330 domain-containing protein [Ancylobacter sp. IITR112]|uniref:DUF5330 domain-containing protein n=1 Tax=Ancylobacter sp. IITR112 TaxID=3138073 RepID=UPI00352A0A5D